MLRDQKYFQNLDWPTPDSVAILSSNVEYLSIFQYFVPNVEIVITFEPVDGFSNFKKVKLSELQALSNAHIYRSVVFT